MAAIDDIYNLPPVLQKKVFELHQQIVAEKSETYFQQILFGKISKLELTELLTTLQKRQVFEEIEVPDEQPS